MTNLNFVIIQELKHQEICDASASIPLGQDQFIVGNDEDNILRVYSSQQSGKPILPHLDINDYFLNNPKQKEVDIEGVTEVDGVIYWITSHSRNKDAERKPLRHQFFANKITNANPPTLKKVGKSYTQLLLRDMIEDPKLAFLDLQTAETIAPEKEGGLNIEGLTATPQGELLIGFRNPVRDGKAILIPFKNPQDVIKENQDIKAEFCDPILLDLGELGIRSIEYWSAIDAYLIIGGDSGTGSQFTLYTWSGKIADKPNPISLEFPPDFRPESILIYPHLNDQFQILSDDGGVIRVDGKECKKIPSDNPDKFFRSVWVKINKLSEEVKE